MVRIRNKKGEGCQIRHQQLFDAHYTDIIRIIRIPLVQALRFVVNECIICDGTSGGISSSLGSMSGTEQCIYRRS